MSNHELAQLNIGALTAPLDSPPLADFVANLDRINALAERSPGFRWRLVSEAGNATAFRPMGENVIVNLSVWQDLDSLRAFVFRSDHVEIMRRRGEWFERMPDAYLALWWVPRGHRPTLDEALERLQHLRDHGASPHAFGFRTPQPAPDAPAVSEPDSGSFDACPAG
jgi:hypothetical protein